MSTIDTLFKRIDETPHDRIIPKITHGALRKLETLGELPVQMFGRAVESKKFLLVREDDPEVIRDIYYPKQQVSEGDVSVNGTDVFSAMKDIRAKGYFFRGWEHVHPPFYPVEPSSTDINNNEALLGEVPLELTRREYVPCRIRYRGKLVDAEAEVSTNYLVCLISHVTLGTIETILDRVASSLLHPDISSKTRHVEVVYRKWSNFFVPSGYSREETSLEVVSVDNDVAYEPEAWRQEVARRTLAPSYYRRSPKKINLVGSDSHG